MSDLSRTDDLFFTRAGLDRGRVEGLTQDALKGTDDGELFLEYRQSESLAYDDGKLKSASFDTTQGFGLRAVVGESAGYAHSTELSEAAIKRAAGTIASSPREPPGSAVRSSLSPSSPRRTARSVMAPSATTKKDSPESPAR